MPHLFKTDSHLIAFDRLVSMLGDPVSRSHAHDLQQSRCN